MKNEIIKDLEASFGNDICHPCGKEFYKTYFIVCNECLPKLDEKTKNDIKKKERIKIWKAL